MNKSEILRLSGSSHRARSTQDDITSFNSLLMMSMHGGWDGK